MAEETLGTDPGEGIIGMETTLQGSVGGPIGMINKITLEGPEVADVEITTFNSPDFYRDFIASLMDAKTATMTLLYEKSNMVLLLANVRVKQTWTVVFPDGSTWVQKGYINKLGTMIPFDQKIEQNAAIRLSGAPTFNKSSGA